MSYIVCHKKRNNPRMDLRICEMKCAGKKLCKEYLASQKTKLIENQGPGSAGLPS